MLNQCNNIQYMDLNKINRIIQDGLLFEWGLVIIAFCLPLYPKLLNFSIASVTLFWLFKKNLIVRINTAAKNKLFLIPILFYLLHILSFILSENKIYAWKDLQTKLSIVIFPLLFFGSGGFSFIKPKWIEKSFLLGIMVSVLLCVYYALLHSFNNPYTGGDFNISIWADMLDRDWWWLIISGNSYFNYSLFSHFLHPSYYALYLTFGASLIIYRDRINGYSIPNKIIRNILVLILFIVVFLLQSRAGLIGILVFAVWSLFIGSRRTKMTVLYTFLVLLVSIFVLLTGRFVRVTENLSNSKYHNLIKSEIRLSIWSDALHLIKEKPIFGYGIGDAKTQLVKSYKNEKLIEAVEKEFNAHNEYLEVILQFGLVGLSVLLAMFILPLLKMDIQKPLFIIFVALVTIHFVFESMLERIAGVSFVMYFWSYLNTLKLRYDTIFSTADR